MRGKKAQITWFIIIGIVILIGAGTVIYIRSTAQKGAIETVPAGQEVRYEGEQELRSFVDSCLKPIVLQGLEIQRLQGGYIEIPALRERLIVNDKEDNEQIKLTDNSKIVAIDAQGSGNEAPFWVTKYGIAIPSKEFMERELENYVTKELDKCVGDFKQFEDIGYRIEKEPITTETTFAKSVWVEVTLPLKVEIRDIEYEISDFNIEIPINMELIYNIASDLALYEDIYAYLEHHSLDLIEKYSWRGGSKSQPTYLPPKRFTDAGFDCDQTTWTIPEVKDKLKDNYNQNFQYLKIAGTNFEKEIRSIPIEQGVFNSYIKSFFTEPYPTIHADYVYDQDWFFNLDILPKSGNTLKPDRTTAAGIPMLPIFCTFKYRFNYFYDFPILLKVKDDSSAKIDVKSNTFEKNAGYEFHVPLWVYVCGNRYRECTGRAETYEIKTDQKPTAFCDEKQKISGDIKITVLDSTTAEPLEDVDVYYYGANSLQNCFIERTNEEGQITSKFPLCSGCLIDLFKQNYSKARYRFDVMDKEDKEVTFNLDPFVDLDVDVKLIHIPTFARSWRETEHFNNLNKMIESTINYGYSINQAELINKAVSLGLDADNLNAGPPDKLAELKNFNEFKNMMSILKGEKDLNPDYEDMTFITGTGLNEFYYSFPDPYNRKLSLGAGKYNVDLVTMGKVEINYPDNKVHKDLFNLGPGLDYEWNINNNDLKGKTSVTFYSLVEHTSAELNPADWREIGDDELEMPKEEYLPYVSPKLN